MKNDMKPWVSNYPPLQKWLKKIGAVCQEQIPVGDPREPMAYIEKWLTSGPMGMSFIVEVRARKMGWNIFTPCASSAISETLKDAERRLDLPYEVTT